jgi:hypothetical protein
MVERQLKGLSITMMKNIFRGTIVKEKFFMAMYEDVSEEDGDVSPFEALPKPMILSHPLIHQKLNCLSL